MSRELRNVSLDMSQLKLFGEVTIYTFLPIVFVMMLIALVSKNRGKCSYAIWQNVSFMQLIHWIGLINIDDNSEFGSFFQQISMIFRPFTLNSVCVDEAISVAIYNDVMNISSNSFINNTKEILIIYSSVLALCVFIIIISKLTSNSLILDLAKNVKYSIVIRLHLLFYLDFMTFSMINIYFFSGKTLCSSVNMGLSLLFLIIGGAWIIIIPLAIKRKMSKDLESHHDVLFQSIETLVQEFKPSFKTITYQYYSIYLLYRISLAFSLVILINSPTIQLFAIGTFQIIISIGYLVFYVAIARPFLFLRDMITVLISECLYLCLVIFIGIRSLSLSSNAKYYITISCVFLIWAIELVIIARFLFALFSKSASTISPIDSNFTVANEKQTHEHNLTKVKIDESFDDLHYKTIDRDIVGTSKSDHELTSIDKVLAENAKNNGKHKDEFSFVNTDVKILITPPRPAVEKSIQLEDLEGDDSVPVISYPFIPSYQVPPLVKTDRFSINKYSIKSKNRSIDEGISHATPNLAEAYQRPNFHSKNIEEVAEPDLENIRYTEDILQSYRNEKKKITEEIKMNDFLSKAKQPSFQFGNKGFKN